MKSPKFISKYYQKQTEKGIFLRGEIMTLHVIARSVINSFLRSLRFPKRKKKKIIMFLHLWQIPTLSLWMNYRTFLRTVQNFQHHAKSSKNKPVL